MSPPKAPKLRDQKKQPQQDQSPAAASAYAADAASKEKGEPSLTSTFTILQRTQLIQLLAACTAVQRDSIASAFSADAALDPELRKSLRKARKLGSKDKNEMDDLNPSVDPGKADVAWFEEQRKLLGQREEELRKPEVKKLKEEVLKWFDGWREEMVHRVGEVVKLRKEAKRQLEDDGNEKTGTTKRSNGQNATEQKVDPEKEGGNVEEKQKEDAHVDSQLTGLYPPVKTPLAELPRDKRALVIHSMLLILLSLEHYSAPSRVLLLHLCTSLDIPLPVLDTDEAKTATGLIEGAKQLSANSEAEKAAQANQSSRRWKVGLATAAGAAIIGVTGGLAAPLVAAGVGSVMGGLGLGATAAAGYLGSLAGSSMLVGGLFGAYGGRMTGQMMDNYAKEVSDFAFLPVHDQQAAAQQAKAEHESANGKRPKLTRQESQQNDELAGQRDPASRRLRVTIGVSGWLTSEEEVVSPWKVLGTSSEAFALRFDLEALMNLGHAMSSMVSTAAWGYAKKTLISSTILADLAGAVAWPIGLIQVARVVDNPFSVAKARADKAGVVLADALINRAQGERPVSLIGYSLGARVVFSCLKTLAARKAFGLIDSAILIGCPSPSTTTDWRELRSVASGRLVNVYSEHDYVLGFLYRAAGVQYGVAGLQPIQGVAGVENVDVSETVSGHLRYQYVVGGILRQIGWEDLSEQGLQDEHEALARMEREQKEKTYTDRGKEVGVMVAGFERTGEETEEPDEKKAKPAREGEEGGDGVKKDDPEAEKEVSRLEREVRDKTNMTLLQRGAQYLAMYGNRNKLAADEAGKAAGETSEGAGDVKRAGKDVATGVQERRAKADEGAKKAGKDGVKQESSSGYGSYLPDMSNMSMPKMADMPSMPSMPGREAMESSWASWTGRDGKGQPKAEQKGEQKDGKQSGGKGQSNGSVQK